MVKVSPLAEHTFKETKKLTMKTFETVKDIFENTQNFHHFAAEFYQQLGEQTSNERTKMLLSYMYKHEQDSASALKQFAQHTDKSVLNTWIQITLENSPKDFFKGLSAHNNMSLEEVGVLGQKVDAYLVDVFDDLQVVAATEDHREIFRNLMEMEKTKKRRLSQAVNSLIREM